MLKEIIRKHALKNAYDYGKANEAAIIGKVVAEFPDAKKDMRATMGELKINVKEINALSKPQIEAELKNFSFSEKPREEERRFRIDSAEEGKVITRFLPEPNGYLHIGHAKAAMLSMKLAEQYSGKCILRFDDTNPENESQEFVDAIKRNLNWLNIEFASEHYTSDKMPQLYQFAEKLIILGSAYVCSCNQEEIKRNRFEKKDCNCRSRVGGENLRFFGEMKTKKAEPGRMILRFKGNMNSPNTVMRDPTLFRILSTEHFRQGDRYWLWPTYDFEVSISDSLDGVTHALRSKEYELRDELYYAILDAVKLRKPVVYDYARLEMKGTLLSKRHLKALIENQKVSGWEDPRMPTLDGLRRRGILPEAIKEFVLRQGLGKVESEPEFEDLLAINRKLLDPIAPHYFFVPDPVKLIIRGKSGEFYVPSNDAQLLKEGEVFRLKDHITLKIIKNEPDSIETEEIQQDEKKLKKIQWVSARKEAYLECKVMEPSRLLNSKGEVNEESMPEISGYCQATINKLEVGEIVQFERYGFCILDAKEPQLVFIRSC